MHSIPIKDQIKEQKNKVKLGSPKIEIIAPCIINDGIIALNSDEQTRLIALFDECQKDLLFFSIWNDVSCLVMSPDFIFSQGWRSLISNGIPS